MTYDELIAEIKRLDKVLTDSTGIKALLAVVQWHSPEGTGCLGCGYDVNYSEWNQSWPCPTIKAITRELA
jgi:hypothetical protein